ncbi:Sensory/regulatory protein RpfC [Streptomyces hundungensis]|uniref:Sensory/regulatory protein RpfC n=1 Tax=Streptomyces hundungensis TaxID=1077946 RepID=A0A387HDX0_9ACTN|nr:response regulator [Streptomyces hundungensis]AYG78907.1 Sensory/regulatory protein RpfC [Streptomyces hundungensis]
MPAPSPAVGPPGSPPTTERALLLVDDHEDNLFALEHVLAPLGRRLLRATSGEQALKTVLRHPVAAVVMDVAMPGIDGLDTLSYLSRLDLTREVPVLLITGTGRDDRLAERAFRMGAAGLLIKPVDPWALRCHVRGLADLCAGTRPTAAGLVPSARNGPRV